MVTFTMTVTNEGPHDAEDVVLSDVLPEGLSYVDHEADQGTYDPDSGRWEVGDLEDNASATLRVSAQVEPGTAGQTIVNTVHIEESDPDDQDPSNNTDRAQVTPKAPVIIEEEPPAAEPPATPSEPIIIEEEPPTAEPPAPPLPVTGGSAALLLIPGLAALDVGLWLHRNVRRQTLKRGFRR